LENAKKAADQNPGYKVFDESGAIVYEPAQKNLLINRANRISQIMLIK